MNDRIDDSSKFLGHEAYIKSLRPTATPQRPTMLKDPRHDDQHLAEENGCVERDVAAVAEEEFGCDARDEAEKLARFTLNTAPLAALSERVREMLFDAMEQEGIQCEWKGSSVELKQENNKVVLEATGAVKAFLDSKTADMKRSGTCSLPQETSYAGHYVLQAHTKADVIRTLNTALPATHQVVLQSGIAR